MTETANSTQEQEVRKLIDSWLQAVATCDTERIMSHYAQDVCAFDAIGPLRFDGAESYGRHWAQCMEHCQPPMEFVLSELQLTVSGDLACGHFLNRCKGTDKEGNEHAMWMRGTAHYRKRDGQWKIVHEHFSAPFDPMSGKTCFDLKP